MSHNGTSPKIQNLAQRILSVEGTAEMESPSDSEISVAFYACEKLRRSLSILAGTAGFRSLLLRALTLAKRQAPVLAAVQVKDDGSLEGLSGEARQAGTTLIAHLINLLVAFIGETLTLRLLRDIWPDLTGFDMDAEGKE
jgi:hypothetical protein